MKKLIFLLLSAVAISQCSAPVTNNELKPDETAVKIFTPAELNGLIEMIKFVDDKVTAVEKGTNINQNYRACFNQLDSFVVEGKMIPALVADSVKLRFLETIGDEAFASVWKINETVKPVNNVDSALTDLSVLKTLTLNYSGKYMAYLNETGKTDSIYSYLFQNIEVAGDIPPVVVSWYPARAKEIDFSQFKARLWAAVYLLRLNTSSDAITEVK